MKYKSRNLTRNKFPESRVYCIKCRKLMDKEDFKLGCARCEWRAHGFDIPK